MSIIVALGIVEVFSTNGAVWTSSDAELRTPRIKVRGLMVYSASLRALVSCPGEAILTWRSFGSGEPFNVTMRRTIIRPGISMPDATFRVELPDSVTPGKWRFAHEIQSQCPRRTQLDTIADFNIEVYAE